MKIQFEQDNSNGYLTYFAIAKDVEMRGKYYEEIMYAEITPGMFKADDKDTKHIVKVTWEDSWNKPEFFDSLDAAKNHVLNNFFKHSFHVNGREADLL